MAITVRGETLFNAVSADEVRLAQIVTGVTMAAFIFVGLTPGLRQHAGAIRGVLLALYLVVCGVLVSHALVR